MARLVLIEDEPALVRSLLPALAAEDWSVATSETGAEGLTVIAHGPMCRSSC